MAAGGGRGVFGAEEDVPFGVARDGRWGVVVDVFRVPQGREGRIDDTHAESTGTFYEGGHVGESVGYAGESRGRTWRSVGVGGLVDGGAGPEGHPVAVVIVVIFAFA